MYFEWQFANFLNHRVWEKLSNCAQVMISIPQHVASISDVPADLVVQMANLPGPIHTVKMVNESVCGHGKCRNRRRRAGFAEGDVA